MRRGFTLVEVLIALAILGVIVALAVTMIKAFFRRLDQTQQVTTSLPKNPFLPQDAGARPY
jgi:prepilin-type N-terminal cleavage/methylation domain-containing protein